jgi:hypothetical protein
MAQPRLGRVSTEIGEAKRSSIPPGPPGDRSRSHSREACPREGGERESTLERTRQQLRKLWRRTQRTRVRFDTLMRLD